eukprot:3884469-Lingulodinium_polyedra.AAC.1
MLPWMSFVRFLQAAPKMHWSTASIVASGNAARLSISSVCHEYALPGCSSIHGTPARCAARASCSAARSV